MEDRKEVSARCCFSAPTVSYRLRSWCNRWLSYAPDGAESAYFSTAESEASLFFLLPCIDGRYRLQLLTTAKSSKAWFLCCRERSIVWEPESSETEAGLFVLEQDEHGSVRLRGGNENVYLSSDWHGRLWAGTLKARKRESFALVEQALESIPEKPPWIVQAPVRVTLQTCSGKYLCAAKRTVSACAEVPCCCEEFILDISFSSLPFSCGSKFCSEIDVSSKPRGLFQTLAMLGYEDKPKKYVHRDQASKCTIRTADGMCLLSAEPDGSLFTTGLDYGHGRETFLVDLHPDKSSPRISIQQSTAERRFLSAECRFLLDSARKHADYFHIQLASGSRVLVKSVHGGFLGPDVVRDGKRCVRCQSKQAFGAWQLRSHGDSFYTLVCTSASERGSDQYMFVDSLGHIFQSSDPSVHFPSAASLFEMKPVTEACIASTASNCGGSNRFAGFTIRTVRKVHGKKRYLSVEPNGAVTALKIRPSRWEIFQLIDVDAVAAAAAPEDFTYMPASCNRRTSVATAPVVSRPANSSRRISGRSLNRACEVAALALHEGQAVPRRSSASLQELCIAQICSHAAVQCDYAHSGPLDGSQASTAELETELSELVSVLRALSESYELLPVSLPAELSHDAAFTLPDDLLSRVWDACRLKQVPRNLCKWTPNVFMPQPLQQPHHARHRYGHGRVAVQRGLAAEGYHCSSCDQRHVLPMDPSVNPAHHRYLEVQSRIYSRAIQSTGMLWNLISLAGVSIMSTALFCQIKAATGGRRSSRTY